MWRIVHAPTQTAWSAATTQQAQLEALVAAFGGAAVTARLFGADGSTLRRTMTYPPLTIDAAASPRRIVLGDYLADAAISTGNLGRWVLRTAGGVDILETSAGTSGASINHAGGVVRTLCPPTISGVTVRANAGLPAAGNAPPLLEWQPLYVAAHSRRFSNGPMASAPVYDTVLAEAVDAKAPVVVTTMPFKSWGALIPGENGRVYISGGLHSGYPLNDIDIVVLPQSGDTYTTQLPYLGSRPPDGPYSGSFSGLSGYYWRQHGGGPRDADGNVDFNAWRLHPGHLWTTATFHPDWGYTVRAPHPRRQSYPDGPWELGPDGIPICSHAQPTDPTPPPDLADYWLGFNGLDAATGRWKTYIAQHVLAAANFDDATIGNSGVSAWDSYNNCLWFISNIGGGRSRIWRAWRNEAGGHVVQRLDPFTEIALGNAGTGDNGLMFEHLEGSKLLVYWAAVNGTFTERHRIYLFNPSLGYPVASGGEARFAELTWPAVHTSDITAPDRRITFTVDRNSRRVFWLVVPGLGQALRFYVSTFDALMTWTPIPATPALAMPNTPGIFLEAALGSYPKILMFRNGYLYMHLWWQQIGNQARWGEGDIDGPTRFIRLKVDPGPDAPPMNWSRLDYLAQNFRFSHHPSLTLNMVKHMNIARRGPTGEYIVCGGDLGGAFNSSVGRVQLDNTPRGYTMTELLSEVQAMPAGLKRPASPDDGFWVYCGADNSHAPLRDKFIYARGGQGLDWASNTYMRPVYRNFVPVPDRAAWDIGAGPAATLFPAAVAAMRADGWTMDRLVIYDPVTNGFAETNVADWPWDGGGHPGPHPITLAADTARSGAYDPVTNCLYRITDYQGTPWLMRYDMVNQTIKGWNCATWVDTAGAMGPPGRMWFLSGQDPRTLPVTANGFGFQDTNDAGRWKTGYPGPWEHQAMWLDARDGRLYGVSPQTGYLWCFETRGTETAPSVDGRRIPFYPVGQRIPLVGCYPTLWSSRNWPPSIGPIPKDTSMNSFMVPFKGGLLWWSNNHHTDGVFGQPTYCFWRALGSTGPWTVVTTPVEFAAKSHAVSSYAHDNPEVLLMAGGGSANDHALANATERYFWRLT